MRAGQFPGIAMMNFPGMERLEERGELVMLVTCGRQVPALSARVWYAKLQLCSKPDSADPLAHQTDEEW